MRSIVCMFSKTPGISSVKTRMSKDIGVPLAEEIFTKSIVSTLKEIQKWNMDYVVAVSDDLSSGFWNEYNTVLQTEGTLGEKLNHIYKALREDYDNIYFIGADSFHLDFKQIEKSISAFEASDSSYIIGETLDGGFYLFGSKEDMSKDTWLSVKYSADDTAKELVRCIKNNFTYLPIRFDLDRLEDLLRLRELDLSLLSLDQAKVIEFILKRIK